MLREAMDGCDVVYYCVVDTRAWLRDPAPLFRTNVEGTARRARHRGRSLGGRRGALKKFVFTSSYSTVGRKQGRVATEDDVIDRGKLTHYVRRGCRPRTWCCSTRASAGCPRSRCVWRPPTARGDYGMTPHGAIIAGTAFGKLPFVLDKIALEAVGVEDAARAMILAAERGGSASGT